MIVRRPVPANDAPLDESETMISRRWGLIGGLSPICLSPKGRPPRPGRSTLFAIGPDVWVLREKGELIGPSNDSSGQS
jgi:hypothetical protein